MKTRHNLPRGIILVVLLSTQYIGCAQDTAIEQSRALVKTFVEKNNIPGLSVTVAKKGSIVWSAGFGYADLEHQVKVDPAKTLFRVGSVSKTLTATAMGQLIEQNKLDVEAPIQQYVPSFPKKKWDINLRQLAGHTAGIRHYRGTEFLSSKRYETVLEGLAFFKDDPLRFEPGTQYAYSSYGWNLISAAIENASGKAFLAYMNSEVFQALDMSLTSPDYHEEITPNRTRFYALDDNDEVLNAPFVDNSYKWAGGGFLSTTEDLIKFGNAFTKPGFLKKETIDILFTPHNTSDGKSTNYGFGWRKYKGNDGGEWYGHSGGSVGGSTIFIISPKEEVVVAIVANLSGVGYGRLHFDLAQLFLEQ